MASQENIEVLTTVPFPESVMQQLRTLSPRIRITLNPATKIEEIPHETWQRTEVLYTDILLPDLAQVPNLKWVQFHYAGVDYVQGTDLLNRKELKITSMSGACSRALPPVLPPLEVFRVLASSPSSAARLPAMMK